MLHRPIRCLTVLLLLLGACRHRQASTAPTPDGGAAEAGAVRVLVYNIHAGKDAAGRTNLDDVAALVRSVSATPAQSSPADLVLLQEVDRGTQRSGNIDQLQVLMSLTGFDGAFGRTIDYQGGQYGIAALARDGFSQAEVLPLPVSTVPPGASPEPRVVLVTLARTRLGEWQALTTHLDASASDQFRLQQVDRLLEVVRARLATGTPLLLGGDMNATPDSAVIRTLLDLGLRDAWTECGLGDGFTIPAARPTRRIDYLFLTGSLGCTSARVIETTASDHRPLLVTVVRRAG